MRDASFHLLDRAAWPRSEHFDYYIRTVKCRYDLTAHLAVTALRERGKALGLRFYPLLLYITARAINANREFRMGFNEHGAPGYWDFINPSYTIFHDDDKTFSDVWSEYDESFPVFYQNVLARHGNLQRYQRRPGQTGQAGQLLSHVRAAVAELYRHGHVQATEPPFLPPIITFGKYFAQGPDTLLPIAVSVHHAAARRVPHQQAHQRHAGARRILRPMDAPLMPPPYEKARSRSPARTCRACFFPSSSLPYTLQHPNQRQEMPAQPSRGHIMPKSFYACLSAVLVLVMLAFAYGEADARSYRRWPFLRRTPSMSQPYTKPLPSNPSSSFNQQTNRQSQQMANSAAPSRGLFGGMGGMLGGLLAGSLLGSLLFGGGFNGGGFLDIILIGGLLFLAFKFFSRRRAATQGAGQPNAGGFDSLRSTPGSDSTHQRTAAPQSGKGGFDWEALTTPSSGQQPLYQDEPKKPAGFDEEEFLRGAKAAYTRLNNAWDKRDLSDIAQFSTPAFQKEIQQQAAEDKTPGNTEIMLVNASLLSVDTVGDEQIAQVYFNVLLREDPSQEAPIDVRRNLAFRPPRLRRRHLEARRHPAG